MTYIIGEIGQNHNGSIAIAKSIIDIAANSVTDKLFNIKVKPMDAVKMTKRDLECELSDSQMNKIYDSPNSFAKTYGEHRKILELSNEEHYECFQYAKKKDLDFIETLCSPSCISILKLFTPDYLKVASRDLTNIPLLNTIGEADIPIILSTGMSGKKELDKALNIITKYHSDISILHCVSQYPTEPSKVNLKTIEYLKENYKDYKIGYSDHTIGISAAIAAISLGAKIIEKHITLDRNMKGTDQKGSLGPDGIFRMVRDIRLLEMSIGIKDIFIDGSVESSRVKLERSIATNKNLKINDIITLDDIHLLSPGDGYKWSDKNKILGKKIKKNLPKNEVIYEKDIK